MAHLVKTYGAWLIGVLIGLESAGIPLPGETTLFAAAIAAGTTHKLSIWIVIAAGIVGGIVGNLIGFAVGWYLGYRVLLRYGSRVHMTEARLKIGEYLFRHYGILVVVFARFVPFLRSLVPLLAGANRMPLRSFAAATVGGAVLWITFDGVTAYYFGREIAKLPTPGIIALGLLAAALIGGFLLLVARNEKQLQMKAEKEIPGVLPRR